MLCLPTDIHSLLVNKPSCAAAAQKGAPGPSLEATILFKMLDRHPHTRATQTECRAAA